MSVRGLPQDVKRASLDHFRIDTQRSNSFTVWKEVGSPQIPSAEQCKKLEDAGQLQPLTSPSLIDAKEGRVRLEFTLPRQGLSLLRIHWE